MKGDRSQPALAADLANLQQELLELHQRVKMAAAQSKTDASGHEGGMVIRGK